MAEDNETSAGMIIQNHTGSGDNVLEKHVHHAIAPSAIRGSIGDILTSLRHRSVNSAKEKLSALQSASQLNSETESILSVISVLTDLACGNPPDDSYSLVQNCLRDAPDGLVSDIACSALLRLDIRNERLDDAIERYKSNEHLGEYCQEVFFEFIAGADDLEKLFSGNELTLSEIALCGLTRGLLRCESFEQSVLASTRLEKTYPSLNSKIISLIARSNHFYSQLSPAHYWLITRSEKTQVMEFVDENMALLDECQGKDKRLISHSIKLLNYLGGSHDSLTNVCWKYITTIEQIDSDAASLLRRLKERNSSLLNDALSEIDRAERDFSYRKILIGRLTENSEISHEQFFILKHIAKSDDISDWQNRGGRVNTSDDLEQKFVTIELLCLKSDDSSKSKDEIKSSIKKLISDHHDELPKLNPYRLLDLTNKLSDIGLFLQVCSILKLILPTKDLWLSPLLRNYIVALLNSLQLNTLDAILGEVPSEDWNEFLWEIRARQLDHINDTSAAIEAIRSALEFAPNSVSVWNYYINLNVRNDASKNQLSELLGSIPGEIFKYPSKKAWELLYQISRNDEFYRAESIIVRWFVENPSGCAKYVTDFHIAQMVLEREELILRPSKTTETCLGGYNYLVDGKLVSKLIIRNIEPDHTLLLKHNSPLGEFLLSMKVGETANYGIQEIKLLEIFPPYVATLRFAIDLRQTENDGSDCFYQFTLPDDPEEMIGYLERKLLVGDDNAEEAICSNPNIPLFMKGHRFESSCPVHAALKQYLSFESVKQPLANFGESHPEKVILDAYSIVYLGLTGFVHGLSQINTRFAITRETKAVLEAFLERINRDDYMRMGVVKETGKMQVITSEHIKVETSGVQLAINHALETAEVVSPRLVDTPPDIVNIVDSVDVSVYSSLALSVSNSIPWLCVDPIFARLSINSNFPISNSVQFFTSLSANLDIETKLPGLIHHVYCGLPYPLTHEELIQLSRSKEQYSHHILVELLKKYPRAYPDLDAAIINIHRIVLAVLFEAYVDGEILRGLRVDNPANSGCAEQVFNASCEIVIQYADAGAAEKALALFLCSVLERVRYIPRLERLVREISSVFISGHFMSFDIINSHISEIVADWQ